MVLSLACGAVLVLSLESGEPRIFYLAVPHCTIVYYPGTAGNPGEGVVDSGLVCGYTLRNWGGGFLGFSHFDEPLNVFIVVFLYFFVMTVL